MRHSAFGWSADWIRPLRVTASRWVASSQNVCDATDPLVSTRRMSKLTPAGGRPCLGAAGSPTSSGHGAWIPSRVRVPDLRARLMIAEDLSTRTYRGG